MRGTGKRAKIKVAGVLGGARDGVVQALVHVASELAFNLREEPRPANIGRLMGERVK